MEAEEQIKHFTGPAEGMDYFPIIKALRDDTMSQSELVTRFDISRPTASKIINGLANVLITRSEDGYQLTGAGAVAVREYADAREGLGGCLLTDLAYKPYIYICLNILRNQPLSRGELASKPEVPSRSSVGRLIRQLDTNGIVARTTNGTYALTDSGKTAIDTYDTLVQAFEQILEKGVCLRNTRGAIEALPATGLEDARLETSGSGKAYKTRDKFLEFLESLNEDTTDHIRIFASYYSHPYGQMILPFVEAKTQLDIVAPFIKVHKHLPKSVREVRVAKQVVEPETTSWMLYFGELPCTLVIIDEKWAVIGAIDPFISGSNNATIYSSDPAVIHWALDLFERYMNDAETPAGHIFRLLRPGVGN